MSAPDTYANRLRWALIVLPLCGVDGAGLGRWIIDNSVGEKVA